MTSFHFGFFLSRTSGKSIPNVLHPRTRSLQGRDLEKAQHLSDIKIPKFQRGHDQDKYERLLAPWDTIVKAVPLPPSHFPPANTNMKFRTLHELGHDEREVTLIDDPTTQGEHNPRLRSTDIVLVPHPSNDINDPLRLPQWKKWVAFLNVCLLTFMTCFWLGGLSPAFYLLSLEFNVSTADASGLLVWPVLSAGLCVSTILQESRRRVVNKKG